MQSGVLEMNKKRVFISLASMPKRVLVFYYDGFRSMTVGKQLWILILVKLFLFFIVMKLLFFPNLLERDYDTDEERASAVRTHLVGK